MVAPLSGCTFNQTQTDFSPLHLQRKVALGSRRFGAGKRCLGMLNSFPHLPLLRVPPCVFPSQICLFRALCVCSGRVKRSLLQLPSKVAFLEEMEAAVNQACLIVLNLEFGPIQVGGRIVASCEKQPFYPQCQCWKAERWIVGETSGFDQGGAGRPLSSPSLILSCFNAPSLSLSPLAYSTLARQ